jgi:hypothetical protein
MESFNKVENTNILNLFLGSYEGKIYSIQIDLKLKKTIGSMAFKISENSLKVLVHKDSHLFASGIDEIIHIYDIDKKTDKGMIVTYAGSINNIQIERNFLFASGDESTISIWRMSDFNLLHSLKGHKSPVSHFVIHKTGKFAVSTAKDSTLIIWNLITGTKIIKYRFKDNLQCKKIILIKKQSLAALIFDNEIWIFDFMKKSEDYEDWIVKKVMVNDKINDAFSYKDKLYIFHTNGDMKVYIDIIENDKFVEMCLEKPEKQSDQDLDIRTKLISLTISKKLKILNVVFSNNEIYLFDFNKINKLVSSELTEKLKIKKYYRVDIRTQDRITCMNSIF